jgi:ADP-ribose pyrophosphatase
MPMASPGDAASPLPDSAINTAHSRVVYRNRWMTVREDAIVRADGSPGTYSVVEKADFAVIAAVQDQRIYLVEQYRYPVRGRFWEMPQGSWELSAIEPLQLARAELREETGLIAGAMQHVGHLFLAYGFATQGYDVYLATDLRQGEAAKEASELDLIARAFNLDRFEAMLKDGVIKDATTIAAYGLIKLHGLV